MKNLKFALFLFAGLFIFSCSNPDDNNPVSVQSKAQDQPQFQQEEELIEIGYFQDGEFQFTVSQDELAQVYSSNVELNLGESGEYEEGDVVQSENEDESAYYVVLSGTVGEEGSASISAEVIDELDEEEGLVRISVRPRPVFPGFCYANWCGKCRQSDLAQGNRFCKCLWGPWGSPCPLVDDPTIIWTQ